MAPTVEGAAGANGYFNDAAKDHHCSVKELLELCFQRLSASAEALLFTPDAHRFGVFDYIDVVNRICKTELGDLTNHSAAVVWLASGFLLTHQLIRAGGAVDAHLSALAPNMIDAALLFQFCGEDQPGIPRRATRALTAADIEAVYVANMEFLKPVNMYTTYCSATCRFAKEALATPFVAVAILAMLGLTCIACSSFVKLQAYLEPYQDPAIPSPGLLFPKENVLDDLMQSMTGPLFGHHPLIAVNAPACGNLKNPRTDEVDWPETLRKYEEGLVWLFDWDVEGREDRDAGRIAEMVVPDYGRKLVDANPTITEDVIIAREKNRVGCLWSIWDTETENALLANKVRRKLARHSGFFCHAFPDTVREIFVVVTSYFAFGFWPSGDWHDVASVWHEMTGYIGSMVRGNMVDHDTEADIGEHNGQNWLCKTCACGVLEWATRVDTLPPKRTVVDQRLAWGPQTYFFYSRRHSGLARRVCSRKFLAPPDIHWSVVTPESYRDAIAAPLHFQNLEAVVLYTLNLAGLTTDAATLSRLCAAMPPPVDPATVGLCAKNCAVGLDMRSLGLEMMMYGHGTMVLAAMLTEPARRRFVWELDGYSTRAFPTLYSRMLSTCECSAYWIESVLQLGYGWALGTCGCDNCDTDEDIGFVRPDPNPVAETGCAWFADARVKENLGRLKRACQERFEMMPIDRQQIESGRLQEGWSILPCADQVRAKMTKEGSKTGMQLHRDLGVVNLAVPCSKV